MTEQDAETLLDAIRTMNAIANLGDFIYDVREREGKGWDGPKVTAWSNAYTAIAGILQSNLAPSNMSRWIGDHKIGVTP